jgi:hypothetical protein
MKVVWINDPNKRKILKRIYEITQYTAIKCLKESRL